MTYTVLQSGTIVTLARGSDSYGMIEKGAIVLEDGHIAWIGPEDNVPETYASGTRVEFGDRVITPGLIDCHTHLVFGGDRAAEFEKRLNGVSYEDIAKAGGGIFSTVNATRSATEEDLLHSASRRLDHLIAEGVTTVEIKSGYGLDETTEFIMLRTARRLGEVYPVDIFTSFLGAHSVPAEFKDNPDGYVDHVCIPVLRKAAQDKLVDAVDGFCEGIAFSPEQIERVFKNARELALPVKLHAEQLSNQGGTRLAARYGAQSADHLEYATDADAEAMAGSGTVAVLLPGAFYTIKETQTPPIDAFRRHCVPMAVATDCNPGSSPLNSILTAMNMACTCFGLTPLEALAGTTRNAAMALGLSDRGNLAAGKRADLAVWDIDHPSELSYRIGFNPLYKRYFGGVS